MAVWSSYAFILMVMLLETAIVSQDCDTVRNVALSVIERKTCPSEPVTARCVAIAPVVLVWKVTEVDKECNVLCKEGPVICDVEEIYDVKVTECSCDETVITSEATFKLTSKCNVMLSCSSRDREEQVSVSIKGLNKPSLLMNYTIANIKSETYEVTVWWTEGDCAPLDVDYVVSFTNSSSGEIVNAITNQTQMTRTLYRGTNYTVTVTAQLCGGNLTSETSKKLPLYYPGDSSMTSGNSPSNQKELDNSEIVGAVVGTLAGVVIISILLFVVVAVVSRCLIKTPERSGVAAIYVDDHHIYYSCTEEYKNNRKCYLLRKCTHDGKVVHKYYCDGFICGIRKYNDESLYVLVSKADSEVLKLNKSLKFKIKSKCADHLGTAYGILVTPEYVLVCSRTNKLICVLNLCLEFCFNIQLQEICEVTFDPFAIATVKNKYFVTGIASIVAFDIDFAEGKPKDGIMFTNVEGNAELFEPQFKLRGICASDRYLYVTQIKEDKSCGKSLLCLEFDGKRLKYVCEENDYSNNCSDKCCEKCCPTVVAYHATDNTIFYTQGSFGKRFHIVKANHSSATCIESTKLFDV